MTQENATKRKHSRSASKSRSILLSALLLLVFFAVSGTVAYLIAKTSDVENTFQPVSVSCEVKEEFEKEEKSSVTIENTGDIDVYVRLQVIGNTVNEEGYIINSYDVSDALSDDEWIKVGDYYYWPKKIEPGCTSGEFLKKTIDLTGKQVIILAEAIQAEPEDALVAANWGWTPEK